MNKYLIIFQIGSVQDFISIARKTRDYFSGSFLISELTQVAIDTFTEKFQDSIIYPVAEKNKLEMQRYGTIPNRFVAIADGYKEAIEDTLIKCIDAVKKEFNDYMEKAKKYFEKSAKVININEHWKKIWDRQKNNIFDFYYEITEYNDDITYDKNYEMAERNFAGRKAMRQFSQIEPEPGFKCTLCGIRQQLIDKDENSKYKDYTKFWEKICNVESLAPDISDNERLCAVCLTKRLYSKISDNKVKFYSTSTIAMWDMIKWIENNYQDVDTSIISDLIKIFGDNNLYDNVSKKLYNVDGRAFILDEYDNLEKDLKNIKIENSIENLKKNISNILEKAEKEDIYISDYLALIQFDGDNIGDLIAESGDSEEHKISKLLYEFGSNKVPEIEKEYLARLVYCGGDEGVIFVNLKDLFNVLDFLHKTYNEVFKEYIEKGKTSISCGSAIFHYQESLKDAISESKNALEQAKKIKNRFCISIVKRAGGVEESKSIFWGKENYSITYLKDLLVFFKNDKLSDRCIYELDREYKMLKGLKPNIIKTSFKRIIKRHIKKEKEYILKSLEEIYNNYINEFVYMLKVSAYIAKGGGKQ